MYVFFLSFFSFLSVFHMLGTCCVLAQLLTGVNTAYFHDHLMLMAPYIVKDNSVTMGGSSLWKADIGRDFPWVSFILTVDAGLQEGRVTHGVFHQVLSGGQGPRSFISCEGRHSLPIILHGP